MKKNIFVDIVVHLTVLLFLYTGIMKIFEHKLFFTTMTQISLLRHFAQPLSIIVPAVELIIAGLLLYPRTKRPGLISSSLLMFSFTIYVGYMLYFQSDRPCSCGGIIHLMTWHQHLYFNALFTILSALALFLDRRKPQQEPNHRQSIYA